MVDEAIADLQAAGAGIVFDAVREAVRVRRDGAFRGNDGTVGIPQTRWAAGSSRIGVGEAFSEAVEPDDLSPDLDRLSEERNIGGHREAQARLHEVGTKSRRVGRMRP